MELRTRALAALITPHVEEKVAMVRDMQAHSAALFIAAEDLLSEPIGKRLATPP